MPIDQLDDVEQVSVDKTTMRIVMMVAAMLLIFLAAIFLELIYRPALRMIFRNKSHCYFWFVSQDYKPQRYIPHGLFEV